MIGCCKKGRANETDAGQVWQEGVLRKKQADENHMGGDNEKIELKPRKQ